MWERLRRFSALPRPAKSLFLRAALLLPLLSLSLRLRGFTSTRRSLQKFLGFRETSVLRKTADEKVGMSARMVLAAARYSPIRSTCLERSLALWWLLGRQGISTQLRIGVRKDGAKFGAHAWVERDGVAIAEAETPHAHYAAFAEELSGDIS